MNLDSVGVMIQSDSGGYPISEGLFLECIQNCLGEPEGPQRS